MDLLEDNGSNSIKSMNDTKTNPIVKESDITDFTINSDEFYESAPKIKLNSAIDIRYLLIWYSKLEK